MHDASPVNRWLRQAILPVVIVEHVSTGLYMAEALQEAGLYQIEVTLRTPDSFKVLEAIAKQYPNMRLSAGTIRRSEDFQRAHAAGATLFISPGFTTTLAQTALDLKLNWMPGIATASEAMQAAEMGFRTLKFFPAMSSGGPKALAGLAGALQDLCFIPTGGVTLATLGDWKAISAVLAVGGTWLTTGFNESKEARQQLTVRAQEALLAWQKA